MKALAQLPDNQITLTLSDEDIYNAQQQSGTLEGIIDIPSHTWDHVITDKTYGDMEYFNKIKINVDDINTDTGLDPNTITITVPQNPTLNNGVLQNIDIENSNLITYNENNEIYGTNINLNLANYNPPDNPKVGFANITENGQYLPDDFDNDGEYTLLKSDNQYLDQINVNVKIYINKIKDKSYNTVWADDNTNTGWNFYRRDTTINITSGKDVLIIEKWNSKGVFQIYYYIDFTGGNKTIYGNSWVLITDTNNDYINLLDKNNNLIFNFKDTVNNDNNGNHIQLNYNIIDFNISWMTFN